MVDSAGADQSGNCPESHSQDEPDYFGRGGSGASTIERDRSRRWALETVFTCKIGVSAWGEPL